MKVKSSLLFSLIICLQFISTPLRAAYNYTFTPLASKAYNNVISLKINEAKADVANLKRSEPENLMVYIIEDYIDFFTIFINENKTQFKALEGNKQIRLNQLNAHKVVSSPYYLFCQAEIHLHWALARLKFEEYFEAFQEVSKAYSFLEENEKKFPNFIANKKSLGILHAMVGTIPDNYKWGVKVLSGMNGTIEQGKKEIEQVLNYAKKNEFVFESETIVMYSFLLLHLNNQSDEAWSIIKSSKLIPTENPLAAFVLANVAMRSGKTDEAIKILNKRPQGKEFMSFHYLDFMLGLCKLYRLDSDAEVYLLKYVQNFKGQNYIKEAYQKLGWCALFKGNNVAYQSYMRLCVTRGNKLIEADKKAYKEALVKVAPDLTLLKSRILFDGGYYLRADELLATKSLANFEVEKNKLEFLYRKGRVAQKLKRYNDAIAQYQNTIKMGKASTHYFACSAALQLGLIYEDLKNIASAKDNFKLCLSMNPDEYTNGLHQQAKAGLNRLK